MVKGVNKSKNKKRNTVLLIDGENIGAQKADSILNAARSQGIIYERKVYGRQKDIHTHRWSDQARKFGISDIRLCGGPVKNKVDHKIMKSARRSINQHKNIDIVCLATNDSDYIDLVRELRALGKRVVVIGEKNASVSLKASCNLFIEV